MYLFILFVYIIIFSYYYICSPGVYFSAHWCPPCRGFTPVLAEFYKKWVEEEGKSLEIVFVSSDRDQEAFDEYYNSMPWAALKFEFRDEKVNFI